jgi:hypothetical protein
MTEPRKPEPEPEAQTRADREPEVRPEVIQDLDLANEDTDNIRGGKCAAARKADGIVYIPAVTYQQG